MSQPQQPDAKPLPNRWIRMATVIFLLIVFVMSAALLLNTGDADRLQRPPTATIQRMTLDPQIIDNMTRLPEATPLSGEAAASLNELRTMVDECDAYAPERRSQMEQHIAWLIDPSEIPQDLMIAFGTNPAERLIFGMATFTSAQWRIDEQPADSCLLPIGRFINQMLVDIGEEPFDIFEVE
jgi:hypothetical protein